MKNKLGTPPSILSRAGLAPVSQSRSFSLIQWKLNLFWTLREEETGFCVLQTTFLKKPKRGDGYLCAGGRGRVFDPDARPSWKEGGGIVCVCRNAAPFPTRPLNHLTSREGSWSALSPLSVWFRLLLGDPSALPGGQPPPSFIFFLSKSFFFSQKNLVDVAAGYVVCYVDESLTWRPVGYFFIIIFTGKTPGRK